ncbi:MAG: FG-GAP-like repeat-containing protein [Acidobacteriota bacterium]|nr:FG-GAP-like repeat-containing protein [Acidobacteriota bacterium]
MRRNFARSVLFVLTIMFSAAFTNQISAQTTVDDLVFGNTNKNLVDISVPQGSTTLVISQVYGGGGNSGATYTNDFVELYNRSATPVSLNGLSIQYSPATTTTNFTNITPLPNVSIAAGKYFLIQYASGGAVGAALPSADFIPTGGATFNLNGTTGKVALINGSTAVSSTTTSGANVIDFVGYGTTANASETSAAPAPSNTTADIRKASGSQDTDNNSVDFTAATPAPRNSSTASPAASFTSANNTTFIIGTAGSFTITTSGTPAVTSITESGTLPSGVNFLDNGNGTATLSGTPATGTQGSYTLTFTANNGVSPNATQTFTLTVNAPAVVAPTTQANNITFSGTTQTQTTASWTNGNGAGRVVYVNTVNSFAVPADGTTPTANTVYGGGQQAVYNGTGTSVTVTGLTAGTTYYFRVYEYNGSGATTVYNTTITTNNPNSVTTSAPTPTLGAYPNATVALSGDVTVTPSAAPTNTTSINVSTDSNFKGTFAANPTTGVIMITDAHPAGTYTVTVRAFNSAGAATTQTFTLTVTSGAACGGAAAFTNATDVVVGTNPQSVAIGDFNNDGKQDLAVVNFSSNNVSIRLGDGAGGFSAATDVGVVSGSTSVAIGDFNNDGKQDLAVTNYGSNTISIRLGDGAGGFSAATDVVVGTNPRLVAIGDFNNDGKQDLAVTNIDSNNVSIRLGDGAGGFSATTDVVVGGSPVSVAIGDFNNDGKQDLAVTIINSNIVSIRLGDGAGGFTSATDVAVGNGPFSVAIGDFNNDGKQDFAVANQNSNNVSIRLGACNLPTVTLAITPATGTEAAETQFTATVTASSAVTTAQTVNFALTSGTAGTADFTSIPATITIPANSTTGSATFNVFNDTIYEGTTPETATFTISNPTSGITIGSPSSATVSITDDDTQPTVSIGNVTQAEGSGGGTTAFNFPVTLSNPTTQTVTVNYSTSDGTAVAPVDYTAVVNGTVTIPAGSTTGTATVQVVADTTNEPDENFTVALSNPVNATILNSPGTGVILNDDAAPSPSPGTIQFNPTAYTTAESGSVSLTVTRTGGTAGAVSATYTIFNGAATGSAGCGAGGDFDNTTSGSTVNFADGDASQTISVPICSDTIAETDEYFSVVLSSPTGGATIGSDTAFVTIIDNDAAVTLGAPSCTGLATSPLTAGSTNKAILCFSLDSNTTTDLTNVNVQFTSSPLDKFNNPRLYKSTDATFNPAEFIINPDGGPVGDTIVSRGTVDSTKFTFAVINEFTGNAKDAPPAPRLAQGITYFFVVADVLSTVNASTPSTAASVSPADVTVQSVAAPRTAPTATVPVTGTTATGPTYSFAPIGTTAALVNVGGRVVTSRGRSISRAAIVMTDGAGNVRVAYTNTFGYYRFYDVEAGQTLIFEIKRKGYIFTQPTQVVSLTEENTGINFTAY